MQTSHFVEIMATEKRRATTYRFYGQGVWKVKNGKEWRPINAIFVPAQVLQVAAAQCSSEPPRQR